MKSGYLFRIVHVVLLALTTTSRFSAFAVLGFVGEVPKGPFDIKTVSSISRLHQTKVK